MGIDFHILMKETLREAHRGFLEGEVPVGAVVAGPDGEIVAKAYNQPISLSDPTAHAEILALRRAGVRFRNYRMEGATLVVTIEPCPMCMGAALHARISHLVFGAFDPRWGAAGSLYDLAKDNRFNHKIEVISGIMEEECLALMQDFFHLHRRKTEETGEVPKWS
ncbi:MAG: tRNA adenosine(34) deaminase TadA [Desulfobacteraceae bacterium]